MNMCSKRKQYKKIGFVDSGLGGLTVLIKFLDEDFFDEYVYLADNKNIPYGGKSREDLLAISNKVAEFFNQKQVDGLIIACNTLTTVTLDNIKAKTDFDVYGISEYGVRGAVQATKNKKVGLLATESAVKSNYFKKALADFGIDCYQVACPEFVEIVETDKYDEDSIRLLVKKYVGYLVDKGVDTIIMGCTHYPLLRNYFEEVAPGVKFIDPADTIIKEFISEEKRVGNHNPRVDIYNTKGSKKFIDKANSIIHRKVDKLKEVNI
ncbi:MAG: glutamate racemase [Finegoldia sp.]|nr:glutamate racemase [Finegoldia sp.]